MVQLFSKTDWKMASSGHLQTIPVRIRKIAEGLNVSIRSVKRYIASLIEDGELVAHQQFGEFGQQTANVFTMPKLAQHLSSLDLKDIEEEIGQSASDLPLAEGGGDSSDTPNKQNSFSKRNTYIRFLEIGKKEEFLAVSGSVRYVPQILSVIRKARPGVDPDLIYRWFKEFISRPGFELQAHIPHYFALLRIFARGARLPGDPPREAKPATPSANARTPAPQPEFGGPLEPLQRAVCKEIGTAPFAAWFNDVVFAPCEENQRLRLTVRNEFIRGYLERTYGQILNGLARHHGLRAVDVFVDSTN